MKDPSRPGIRLLGELQLVGCDGRAVALPASRKTRALLGYLIATGQLHRRERLCDLLWDGPDDPRAELRWSLSKIRAVLNDEEGMRLTADRERVGVELGNAVIDIQQVRSLLGDGVSAAPIAALKEAASLFGGGEFLDGLDLPLCYRYQEWCMAEREVVSRLRLAVLTTLVKRLQNHPGDALAYARALTTADPLSESGHAAVVRLLAREGRNKEALGHYEHASRLLEVELGVLPSAELEEARQTLRSTASATATVAAKPPVRASGIPPVPGRSPLSAFVGREAERALIDQIVAMRADRPDVVLVTGEPGIGKSRILAHIGERVISAGGRAFAARAYEAEAARSYGVWIDVIREILRESPRDGLPADLSLLLPEMGAVAEAGDRTRLLDSVVGLLRQVVSARPAAVILDDLQWVDEGSSSLLHYVARHIDSGLLIVCAARAGEIEDNSAASRVLRSLARDGRLREIELAAMSEAETAQLIRQVDPSLDAAKIFAESGGNPLFSLELAHAHRRGDAGPGRTVEALIGGQLAPLAEGLRETLVWAAAHGRAFSPDDLARSARLDDTELLSALGELERRGLIRPVGGDAYDFTHDLVRQTAYRTLSQPRRKLLHRRIARALDTVIGRDGAFAADIAYHAALAEDDDMAAHACRLAGERALRQFANAEAASFAERGLRHAERLAEGPARLELRIAMLKIRVLGATGPGLRPLPPLADTIAEATSDAEALGLQAAAATGHYLLSVLHQEAGDVQQAETSTLRAAEAGRAADDTTRARQLANTARCLLELETEIGRSRALIAEASAIAGPISLELCELYWARGLLERWDGNDDHAVSSLGRALDLARRDKDRWREYKCLTWLAMLERERGRYADMHAHCAELETVAARLGDDETPFVKTLRALAGLATEEASADDALASALTRLRAVDDKSYLAYALNSAAHLYRQAGRTSQARLCASEALTVASVMRRHSEIAIARALLAPAGETASAQDIKAASGRDDLSVRARAALLASQARPRDSNGGSHAKPAG
jgi:DNA-binding SARP family transcriptional activator/tetratricopeptide (TPR) repeat protein